MQSRLHRLEPPKDTNNKCLSIGFIWFTGLEWSWLGGLTLKGPGGGIRPPPSTFFAVAQPFVIFSR